MSKYEDDVQRISNAFEQGVANSPNLLRQMDTLKAGERAYNELVEKGVIEPSCYRLSPINTLPLGVPNYTG